VLRADAEQDIQLGSFCVDLEQIDGTVRDQIVRQRLDAHGDVAAPVQPVGNVG
jgi:hypothetical protein